MMNPGFNPYMANQGMQYPQNNLLYSQPTEMNAPQGQMPGNMDFDPTVPNPAGDMGMPPSEPSVETFNMFGDVIDPNSIKEADTEAPQEQLNIGDQINYVREVIENIKTNGFGVESEEFDLEDVYQITIKIQKPNKEENN